MAGVTSDFFFDPIYTFVARLLPDGTRDSTFNGDGYFREWVNLYTADGTEPVDVFWSKGELLVGFVSSVWGPGLSYGALCFTETGELNIDFGQDGIFNHISIFPQVLYTLNDVWLSDDEQSMYFGGTYRLLGNDNMFVSKLDISVKNPTQIRENKIIDKLIIYPNPVNDSFIYIDFPESIDLDEAHVKICDYTGREVMGRNINTNINIDKKIDVSKLVNGVYIATLVSGDKYYAGKFAVFR